jgi:hypothetical protein
MQLNNLTENQVKDLIESLSINPNIEPHVKEPTLVWCNRQLKEQQAGGAWKRRIREEGHVI